MAHLTLEQRYKIETYKDLGKSISEISNYIGKDKSVISREINRNSDKRNGVYKANLADRKSIHRHATKPKKCTFNATVEANILYYLTLDFSPEQIVGKAKLDGKEMISIEGIYQYIWLNKRKGGVLYKHLRTKGKKYKKRGGIKDSRGSIVGRVDIDKRPVIVEAKKRLGDMEMDLIIGQDHKGALLTINDRVTGFLFMAKIDSKEADVVQLKAIELLQEWKHLIKTITSDNGKEFANHKSIANSLQIDYYFAKPYHSWERGANENLNGLVRQYFPKKTSFACITDQEVKNIVNKLNNRPRKRFGYKTPTEIFAQKLNDLDTVAFIT
jgi:IS30 family transposase